VGESYPFSPGGRCLLTFDNHNSVNGIREFAQAAGARVDYAPLTTPDLTIDRDHLIALLDDPGTAGGRLFAFPAQSNFSGVKHPLTLVAAARDRGYAVLLDAAAFAPTQPLSLRQVPADFVAVSFYKMFGYPTGVGCLLARKDALAKLRRPWFAGGTITVASVQGDRYYLAEGEAAFEDGTINYLNLPAVEIGLKHLETIGLETIHERVLCLTGWMLDNLLALKHRNGKPLVRLYGPPNVDRRGGTVTVNFYTPEGRAIDHREIERQANRQNISLRTGCFCNPGGGEVALGLSAGELNMCFRSPGHEAHFTVDDFRLCIDGKSTGAVRMSVGLVSNFADVQKFIEFAMGFVDSD
jgi:selenocysteine lyase/cysteine desulfurase